MKRFQGFYGGPLDGRVEYYPAVGSFPDRVLVAFQTGPPTFPPPDDPTTEAAVGYTVGVYLLASVSRHHGEDLALYRWKRQTGDRPTTRRVPGVAELQRLTKIMATHPDLTGR